MGTYTLLNRGEAQEGGAMKVPEGAPKHTLWLPYIAVEDVDATAERVKELGGTIQAPPMDIPNVGRFTVTLDPTGAPIAFFSGAKEC
jgi:hypothetical protein